LLVPGDKKPQINNLVHPCSHSHAVAAGAFPDMDIIVFSEKNFPPSVYKLEGADTIEVV